jgi:hypothetical protein
MEYISIDEKLQLSIILEVDNVAIYCRYKGQQFAIKGKCFMVCSEGKQLIGFMAVYFPTIAYFVSIPTIYRFPFLCYLYHHLNTFNFARLLVNTNQRAFVTNVLVWICTHFPVQPTAFGAFPKEIAL